MKRLMFAAIAALIASVAVPARAADAVSVGRWAIAARGDDQSHVSLQLAYAGANGSENWDVSRSSTVPLAEAGIPADRLRGPIAPVSFSIRREPGTFACVGTAGQGSGAGQFTYAPDPRFDDALASRGMGRPTEHQSIELAISGTTLAFVDRLRGTTQHVGVADVVRAVQHGVDSRYVEALAAFGYTTASLDDLTRLRDHGVTPELIRSVQQAGYRNLSVDDLVRLTDHGVRERFIAEMRAAGYTSVSADQLITFRDHGVTPRYLADLAAAGYKSFSANEIVALRDHGVTAPFVARLKAHGYANLSAADLIRLRDAGI